MTIVKNFILLLIGCTSFVLTFVSVGKLSWFLSSIHQMKSNSSAASSQDFMDIVTNVRVLNVLFVNAVLAITFVLVHSFFRIESVKKSLEKVGLTSASRSLYCLLSSVSLLVLLKYWKIIPYTLWEFDVQSTTFRYWLYFSLHSLAWTVIYAGSLLMDLPELLGIKQIVYHLQGLPHTCEYYKSEQLNTLYAHFRHPSFICLSLILWFSNYMTLDRLLLAVLFTSYMFLAWNPDKRDYQYQKLQLTRKKIELQQTNAMQSIYW